MVQRIWFRLLLLLLLLLVLLLRVLRLLLLQTRLPRIETNKPKLEFCNAQVETAFGAAQIDTACLLTRLPVCLLACQLACLLRGPLLR